MKKISLVFKNLLTFPCKVYHNVVLLLLNFNYKNKDKIYFKKTNKDKAIVLVHGENGKASDMYPLAKNILKYNKLKNYNLLSLSICNRNGYSDIEYETLKLLNYINNSKYNEIILIGYCKGGIVCLNSLIKCEKIKKVITISSPVKGIEIKNNSGNRFNFLNLLNNEIKYYDKRLEISTKSLLIKNIFENCYQYRNIINHFICDSDTFISPEIAKYDYNNNFKIYNYKFCSHSGFIFDENLAKDISELIF